MQFLEQINNWVLKSWFSDLENCVGFPVIYMFLLNISFLKPSFTPFSDTVVLFPFFKKNYAYFGSAAVIRGIILRLNNDMPSFRFISQCRNEPLEKSGKSARFMLHSSGWFLRRFWMQTQLLVIYINISKWTRKKRKSLSLTLGNNYFTLRLRLLPWNLV